MHYTWRCGQGKYTVEILKRFKMMDCKAMTTPKASNMKLLSVASSESIDATMYRQLICSLMYLMDTRLDTCFAVRYLKGTIEYGLKYEAN